MDWKKTLPLALVFPPLIYFGADFNPDQEGRIRNAMKSVGAAHLDVTDAPPTDWTKTNVYVIGNVFKMAANHQVFSSDMHRAEENCSQSGKYVQEETGNIVHWQVCL